MHRTAFPAGQRESQNPHTSFPCLPSYTKLSKPQVRDGTKSGGDVVCEEDFVVHTFRPGLNTLISSNEAISPFMSPPRLDTRNVVRFRMVRWIYAGCLDPFFSINLYLRPPAQPSFHPTTLHASLPTPKALIRIKAWSKTRLNCRTTLDAGESQCPREMIVVGGCWGCTVMSCFEGCWVSVWRYRAA